VPDRATIRVNRAPVLTLWAAVVAERLGFDRDEALTLGRAVAGLSAAAKGAALGLLEPEELRQRRTRATLGETEAIRLLGRAVPVVHTPEGIRALDKERPASPARVERYLRSKFGDALEDARAAMQDLAVAYPPAELNRRAFALYEGFRPEVPTGVTGWGAAGELDLERIRALAP
jgi:hypothetical protein